MRKKIFCSVSFEVPRGAKFLTSISIDDTVVIRRLPIEANADKIPVVAVTGPYRLIPRPNGKVLVSIDFKPPFAGSYWPIVDLKPMEGGGEIEPENPGYYYAGETND